MQSLCGSFNFFAKAFPGGIAFCNHFNNATIGVKKSHLQIKVTREIKEDASIWIQFLYNYTMVKLLSLN